LPIFSVFTYFKNYVKRWALLLARIAKINSIEGVALAVPNLVTRRHDGRCRCRSLLVVPYWYNAAASCHTQTTEGLMAVTRIPIPDWARTEKTDNRLELSLVELGLIVRTVNLLEEEGIFTVGDLLNCTPERLLRISNIGEKTLDTIYEALAKIGFHPTSKPPVEEVDRRPTVRRFAFLRG
jgi:DNA-directed RNA polymerase subunit alpha